MYAAGAGLSNMYAAGGAFVSVCCWNRFCICLFLVQVSYLHAGGARFVSVFPYMA